MEFSEVLTPSRLSEVASSRSYDSGPYAEEEQSEDLFSSEASNSEDGYSDSSSSGELTRLDSPWSEASSVTPVPEHYEEAPAITKQELFKHIQTRRLVEQMRSDLEEKEGKVDHLREKLAKCRAHIRSLLDECKSLEDEKNRKVESNNLASVGLLTARMGKLEVEISSERAVEQTTIAKLKQAEIELSEAKISSSDLEELEKATTAEESEIQAMKEREANLRLQKETRLTLNAERARRLREEEYNQSLLKQDKLTRTAIAGAKHAQETAKQLMRETSEKKRAKEAKEQQKHQEHVDRRMKAILSLKSNIESSQGTIQAQQMLVTEQHKKRARLLSEERSRILSAGGNPEEIFLTRQRMKEFEKEKEQFHKKRKEKELEIVSRLLEERKIAERNKAKLDKPYWQGREEAAKISTKPKQTKKLRKTKPTSQEGGAPGEITINEPKTATNITGPYQSSSDEDTTTKTFRAATMNRNESEESLAEPEIRGLWEGSPVVKKQSTQRFVDETDKIGKIAKERSKAEREMMQTVMEKLKKSAIIKQVAAGREFKGCPFISKPNEVVFKDFDLGRVYRKKLQLTNISYTVNYCRLIGVSDHLKDFIKIEFNPPGSMSAGLTCTMAITFEPKLQEDLCGEISMLSQTGPFAIPLKCLTKKCLVSVDSTLVEFGSICVGETARKVITLTNNGALPTAFTLVAKNTTLPDLKVEQYSGSVHDSGSTIVNKPLADASNISIMSNIEAGSGMEKLGLGMRLVGGDSSLDRCKSRSSNDLSGVSQKVLSWEQGRRSTPPHELEGKEASGEDPVDGGANRTGREEEAPGDQAKIEDKDALVITAGESQVVLYTTEQTPEPLPSPAAAAAAIAVGPGCGSGMLAGFSSQAVELTFSPGQPTEHSAEFVISFARPAVPQLLVSVSGSGVDVPVYVERETVDLRICSLNRLYQDSLTLHNRASTALRVTFEVPKPLQSCLEVLPQHGLVQGGSSFSAQVKFTPLPSLFGEDCQEYFTSDGRQLEAAIMIRVADQLQPVLFSVVGQVTSPDLSFSAPAIDFGTCTTHESVAAAITLTNKSILPQKFGFVNLPPMVEVQPNDGFGTILPLEMLPMDVIFSASKPKEYSFELTIKTGFDNTYKIPCKGLGVLPPLSLAQNTVSFAPAVLNTSQTASITLSNPKLHRLNSAIIRGAVLPQGPKAFEFAVPKGSPLSISPQVGIIPLGESVSVQVELSPRLDPAVVRGEALELAKEAALLEQAKPREEGHTTEPEPAATSKKKGKRLSSRASSIKGTAPSAASKASLISPSSSQTNSKAQLTEGEEPPSEGSELWLQAYHRVLTGFEDQCVQFNIPCFVSSEAQRDNGGNPAYRAEDTLYVHVTAPIVRPSLVLDIGCPATIDFQSAGIGDAVSKTVRVKNISNNTLNLISSLLDPHGPFELRNALRPLAPGISHQLLLQFLPHCSGAFHEPLKLYYSSSAYLELTLRGHGVKPEVNLSIGGEQSMLDLGHAMAGDCVRKSFTLENQSALGVRFSVEVESSRVGGGKKRSEPFKAANFSGQAPFTCSPFQGSIEPGASCEVTVSFTPDHQSPSYADCLDIQINDQHTFTVHLKGQAWSSNMYILGGECQQFSGGEESMAASGPLPDGQTPPPSPLLVLFTHSPSEARTADSVKSDASFKSKNGVVAKASSDSVAAAAAAAGGTQLTKVASRNTKSGAVSAHTGDTVTRVIQVGCIKTQLVKKTTGDYSIDAIPSSNPHAKAFTIDPCKGSVEAGGQASVNFSFRPFKDSSTKTFEASTNLMLKSDTVQVYKLLVRGLLYE